MEDLEATTEGYGEGFIDGWKSVAGSGPFPPQIAIVPGHVAPLDMTFYEYGFQKGCGEAEKVKPH